MAICNHGQLEQECITCQVPPSFLWNVIKLLLEALREAPGGQRALGKAAQRHPETFIRLMDLEKKL